MSRYTAIRSSALSIACSFALALTANAQSTAPGRVDIAAGELNASLEQLAEQTGLDLIFRSDQLRGIRAPAVAGTLAPEVALETLLRGSGLVAHKEADGAILIQRPGASPSDAGATPERADRPPTAAQELSKVQVVGSQIKGSGVGAALPVTTIDRDAIDALAPSNGDELYREIPQMGSVSFNPTSGATSSNFARGDVASIDLRGLGVGNTLVLLNGRRTVTHPGSQAASLVPVLTYNANAIPVNGVERVEVLRDGAAAIYGADAVGGVVNNTLKSNLDGGAIEVRYGGAEGTSMRQTDVNFNFGSDFSDGRGNVSFFANHTQRTDLPSSDLDITRSSDTRPLFEGTRFEGATSLDGRSTLSAWADLQTPASFGVVRRNGIALTSAAGAFHIQPDTFTNCRTPLGNGLCIDTGNRSTGGADRELRYDSASFKQSENPSVRRDNLFVTGRYELTEEVEAYGELGYYEASTRSVQSPVFTIGSTKVVIPASNYWNPFGALYLPDGTPNPNRLSGLNVPEAGLPVTLNNYRFVDLGPTLVKVENTQSRVLAGVRGNKFGFDWDSALLYSEATTRDVQDGISSTLLQQQLALATPDAYNPFNGGDLLNTATGGDSTPSSVAALEAIKVQSVRRGRSTLAQWDFKVSRPDLFRFNGGDVGIAAGIEIRRETQMDDRDGRVDGIINYTDAVTGEFQQSDLFGVSPTPDTKGDRNVGALYLEAAVPLVSPANDVPLVKSLEVQVAGRFEHYSDFGSVAKPKVALAWDLNNDLRVRGSWSQGFVAPNLEQMNATMVTRGNSRTDWTLCEADLRSGRITSFTNCSRSAVTTARRAGNPDLQPEESESWTAGIVYQPSFLPDSWGRFTLSADYWSIKQENIVGVFGEGNALILDYLLRTQGASNPDVIREAPNADDVAALAGTGLEPFGRVVYVNDQYVNLEPQEANGVDVDFGWRKSTQRFGDFSLNLNAAYLDSLYRRPSRDIAALLGARAAGLINPAVSITEGGNLVGEGTRPRLRWSSNLTWRYASFTLGASTRYIDSLDSGMNDSDGNPWIVKSQLTGNLYGQYRFKDGTSVQIGARNITDEKPPLSSGGYLGALYQAYGRYWYMSLRRNF